MNKQVICLILLTLLTVSNISLVFADQYHYNNVLIGNRASGMAGSYVAVSDDPSGLYYNPSGIVYSSSTNVTANMNAYKYARTKYVAALKTSTGRSVDWVRTTSALVPSFFGITQPLGPGTVGFSYAITDSILEDQSQSFSDIRQAGTTYTINFNNQDITNNVGPSYAIAIGENFSIGLTAYAYFRNKKRIFNQIYQLSADGNTNTAGIEQRPFYVSNQYFTLKEYGVNPTLGFTYTPIEKISLGMTFSQVYLLKSSIQQQDSEATNICLNATTSIQERCTISDPTSFALNFQNDNTNRKFPWKLNMGLAYFHSNRLLLTGTVWIYEAINLTSKPLVNVASGMEYYITGKIAIRLGMYSNLSNTPELVNNAINIYNEHIDIYGATLSLTHFTRSSAISMGTAATYGKGKAQITGSSSIQDVRYVGVSVFLSASNSF